MAIHSNLALAVGFYRIQLVCSTAYPLLPYEFFVEKGPPFLSSAIQPLLNLSRWCPSQALQLSKTAMSNHQPVTRIALRFFALVAAVEREAAEKRKEAGRA